MKSIVRVCAGALALAGIAQAQTGSIVGSVTDNTKKPLAGAVVQVVGTRIGTYAGQDGSYRIDNVQAGTQRLVTRFPGYSGDTTTVTVAADQTVTQNLTMRASTATLAKVTVTASPRLAETKAAAIATMKNADNIMYVESGDDIRALPSLNAAESAERIPGVTTERDEGEGKFVQIRGTEPKLQNVQIDGVHIPGTLSGDRSVKLDDIPSDLIGAIEVSKTLTADQDADAIGGSINFVTKIPETEPRGYLSGLFGYTTLENRNAGQIGATWGGRFGESRKFGFLIGGSYDRNDRPINDIEPSWAANATHTGFFPSDFNQRDYYYFRQRWGAQMDVDYRVDAQTSVYARGLFSRFLNHGYRYVWDMAASSDVVVPGTGTNPPTRPDIATLGSSYRSGENRTPIDNTYGFKLGFRKDNLGPFHFDVSAQLGGSSSVENDYRTSQFNFQGDSVAYQYNNTDVTRPRYAITDAKLHADLLNPNNYFLNGYGGFTDRSVATETGASMNFLAPYALGNLPAATKFGFRFRNLTKTYDQNNHFYGPGTNAPISLAQLQGSLTSSSFYSEVFPGGINLGPFPSQDRTTAYEDSHLGLLSRQSSDISSNALAGYFGNERVTAAYVMQTLDVSRLHINVGLRLESTFQDYRGHVDTLPSDFNGGPLQALQHVEGRHTYNDLFPSAQLKYEIDENTNARLAFTRGIARPDYSALNPTLTGTPNFLFGTGQVNNSLQQGNLHLKAETAWNYDVLFEHYLPASGVISAGFFYKDLKDFIYQSRFFNYTGPVTAYLHANGTTFGNGPGGHIIGWEADWEQHLTFLPSVLSGLGLGANWTHVNSYARIPNGYDSAGRLITKKVALPRTSPDIGNVSGLYNYGPVAARVAWVYQGPNLVAYGSGTSDPTIGDNYFYAHAQVDASLYISVSGATQIQLQGLNLNDAVFGFFNGTPSHQFDTQREFYGRTFYFGLRQSF
jgi:TonB-dependent receptor